MFQNILVIDLAFIGDVILATPAVRALRESFPKARITMMTVPLTESVARMNPYVDDIIVYDKKGREKGLLGIFRMAAQLRKYRFDLAVCMNFAVRGAVVAWLARIPNRFGYDAQHARFFLTRTAPPDRSMPQHEVQNHLDFLRTFNITTNDASLGVRIPSNVEVSFHEKRRARGLSAAHYLVICPCGRAFRRNLSIETSAAFLRLFSKEEDARPVYLIGGVQEQDYLSKIARLAGIGEDCVLAGTFTLPEIAVLLRSADAIVSVDTGPAHIAQMVRCPTVEIFSTGDPRIWGPRGAHDVVLAEECDPVTGDLPATDCIRSISAESILVAVQGILRKTVDQQKR